MDGQWISVFDISFKCQILAVLSVLIVILDFFRSKRLPLRSTKVFGCFLIVCFFNLFADMASVFTVMNYQNINPALNRFIHMLFYCSIELMSLTLFLYVFYLFGAQKRFSKRQVLLCAVPCVLAAIGSSLTPIYYVSDEQGAYSYGPALVILYAAVVIYIVGIYVILFRKCKQQYHSDVMNDFQKARITIAIGLGIWIVVALIQFITKYLLISSIGNCLMVLYIYLCFENPKRYADEETDTLNRSAFHIMVPEMLARKKPFWLVSFTIDDNEQISKSMGYDQMKVILRTAVAQLKTVMPKSKFFHSRSNTLSLFLSSTDELEALLKKAGSSSFAVEYGSGTFTPQYHITVLECPKYAETPDEIYDTLDHVLSHHHKHENGKVLYIDENTIKDKNYRKNVLAVLTKAVQNKAFNVVYQPIYSTKDKRFASAEALVRLQDCGELGFISPEVFIPMAEEQGLVAEIGSIVFEKVCSFAAENKLWEKGINYIEVNLSGMQSVDPSLPAQLTSVMQKYGIEPKFINLEITETASIDGGELLDMNMKRLRSLGCHFSMDDFGTGYSNLAQMARVHFELVKLDKSLIWPAFGESPDEPMVILNSCIAMILQLGAHIVAEGVETKEQAEFLTERGVNYLQGYYFSKPIPGEAFLEKISAV
ncbi:MAG: EAL domain-containing protein [Oscillospiraceae bacterium]|nr:EAL domain-containing protein [Oscillospiraceae bacterium]